MRRILLVGNGQPAAAAARLILARPELELGGLLTSDPAPRRGDGLERRPEALVRDPAALAEAGLLEVDWLIIANSTVLVPRPVLTALRGGALNLHPGLLPEYAGLHVHQWAIRRGEREFGATIHRVVGAVDAGPIVAQSRFAVDPDDTGLTLFRKCMRSGQALLVGVLERLATGAELEERPQDLTRRHVYRHADALADAVQWDAGAGPVRDFIRAGNYGPFRSPTYTATLRSLGPPPIELLAARVEPSASGEPGTVLTLTPEGPLVACGADGVTLLEARTDGRRLEPEDWRRRGVGAGTRLAT